MNKRKAKSPSVPQNEEGPRPVRGDARPPHIGSTERRIKTLFGLYRAGTDTADKSEEMERTLSHLDYKVAQQLDSKGYTELARKIAQSEARLGQRGAKESWFQGLIKRTFAHRFALGLGTVGAVVILFGLTIFGVIWYRGSNIPILRNIVDQPPAPLSFEKSIETEYGVGISDNSFTLVRQDGVTFRSLGIGNKVSIVPEIDFSVELLENNKELSIVPEESLEADTEYSVTLREGAMFSDGTTLKQDYTWVFRTEPVFAVAGITPRDGSDSAPYDSTIEVEFTYKDIDPDEFSSYFSIVPPVSGRFELHGKKIVFLPDGFLAADSVYKVTVKQGFTNSRGDVLDRDYGSIFQVSSRDSSGEYISRPYLYWSLSSPVVTTTESPWIGMYDNEIEGLVDFTVYSMAADGVIDIMEDYHWDIFEKPSSEYLEKVSEFSKTPSELDAFEVPLRTYGIYLLEAYSASYGRPRYKIFVYSPAGAVLSDGKGNERLWLFDMNEREPLSGGTVQFYDFDVSDPLVHEGQTDTNGYAVMEGYDSELVIAEYAGNYVAVLAGRYSSSADWWMGGWSPVGSGETDFRAYVYSDRPLYRPGDTMHFKTIVRSEDDMSYDIPANETVTMRVGEAYYGWNGYMEVPYYEETFQISGDFGTAAGEFEIPSNMVPGSYDLTAFVDGVSAGSFHFLVEDYEKPRYTVEMSANKTRVFSGETVTYDIVGKDYSGDPAAGLQVRLSVSASENEGSHWVETAEEFNEANVYSYGSTPVTDQILTLDAEGRASYDIVMDASSYDSTMGVYTAYVTSTENYTSYDSETTIVVLSNDMVFVKPEKSSLEEGGDNELTLKTVSLWSFSPLSGVSIEYDLERKWTEWVESGSYYDPETKAQKPTYSSVSHTESVVVDRTVITGTDGTVTDTVTDLPFGTYKIRATYYSDSGVTRVIQGLFYVYENPDESEMIYDDWAYPDQAFSVYLDKDEYEVGDTATIVVKSTLDGKGLFLVSRGDVYEWRPVDFSDEVVTIQQSIDEVMAPWISVCVWGINSYPSDEGVTIPQLNASDVFVRECRSVSVHREYGELSVDVQTEESTYEPGDEVTLNVRVTDGSGKGVQSEVSVDVIDRALLDIIRQNYGYGAVDIYARFYGQTVQHASQVSQPAEFSSYGGFGGGGDGGGGVRSNFADAAFWKARVETDSDGRAQVAFTLPDNLTTWVAQAVAVTPDTWVGQGESEFVARKDVRMDAHVPEFIRSGDSWDMNIEVSNYSNNAVDGVVSIACEGCERSAYSDTVALPQSTIRNVTFPVKAADGEDSVVLTASLASGNTIYDAVEWRVPVLPQGFMNDESVSALLEDGVKSEMMNIVLPEGIDLARTEVTLTAARSYVNESALVPVDPSISSSVELASSIIHNSVFVEYYDRIKPDLEKYIYEQKITSALDLLKQNQADNGGFGWFDYDAVNYEMSAYVGIALGRANDVGLAPEGGRMENLSMYLQDGLSSDTTSIDEKIFGAYALTELGDNSILPYLLNLKNDTESFDGSALDVAYVMLALQNLGSMGDASELIPYLATLAEKTQRYATWKDADAEYRVLHSQEYTTALVYRALSPYNHELEDMARMWLVENPVSTWGNAEDAVAVFYALTVANIGNIAGRSGVNKVTILVNGQGIRSFDVGGDEDYIGKVGVLVPSGALRVGDNAIEIQRSGDGELYTVVNVVYYAPVAGDAEEFDVVRTIRDFETMQPVSSVEKGDVVLINTKVTVDRDGYNLVVHDFLPAGFEPIRYTLGGYDYEYFSKWWRWGADSYTRRYGTIAQDHITYSQWRVEDGDTFYFEFPAVATYEGRFWGAGSQGYLLGAGDVGGHSSAGWITVE